PLSIVFAGWCWRMTTSQCTVGFVGGRMARFVRATRQTSPCRSTRSCRKRFLVKGKANGVIAPAVPPAGRPGGAPSAASGCAGRAAGSGRWPGRAGRRSARAAVRFRGGWLRLRSWTRPHSVGHGAQILALLAELVRLLPELAFLALHGLEHGVDGDGVPLHP